MDRGCGFCLRKRGAGSHLLLMLLLWWWFGLEHLGCVEVECLCSYFCSSVLFMYVCICMSHHHWIREWGPMLIHSFIGIELISCDTVNVWVSISIVIHGPYCKKNMFTRCSTKKHYAYIVSNHHFLYVGL